MMRRVISACVCMSLLFFLRTCLLFLFFVVLVLFAVCVVICAVCLCSTVCLCGLFVRRAV